MTLSTLERPPAVRPEEAGPETEGRLYFVVTTALGIVMVILAFLSIALMGAAQYAIASF